MNTNPTSSFNISNINDEDKAKFIKAISDEASQLFVGAVLSGNAYHVLLKDGRHFSFRVDHGIGEDFWSGYMDVIPKQ